MSQTGLEARLSVRAGRHRAPTAALAPGYVQANLAILPRAEAFDFLRYCTANPKPCPVLAVSEPGDWRLPALGADLDVRTDVPGFQLFRDGAPAGDASCLRAIWSDDLVVFALGCSFSFEQVLLERGIPVRHLARGRNVAMYVSNLPTRAAGRYGGPMVVSMRPMPPADALRAVQITARFPSVHGAPVHLGDPAAIGIADLSRPDFGDPSPLEPGDIPVFWACGVTPQIAMRQARPAFGITHKPGHMLVTDLRNADLAA